jgi:hypothetical protein
MGARYVLTEFVPMKLLTKAEIESALIRLSELAAAEGIRLEMTLYGGALMLLAYDARDVTKDVDAIVYPPAVARRLAAKVAAERGLHESWLNDDVKQFVSPSERKNEFTLLNVDRAGLHITRPTAKYLLAMKVMASRKPMPGYAGDYGDIEILLRITKIRTIEEVQKVIDAFFPDTVLPLPVQLTLTEFLENIHAPKTSIRTPQPPKNRSRGRKAR